MYGVKENLPQLRMVLYTDKLPGLKRQDIVFWFTYLVAYGVLPLSVLVINSLLLVLLVFGTSLLDPQITKMIKMLKLLLPKVYGECLGTILDL